MFKRKSFNLINDEELRKSENSNKYGWIRCLIIPAIIGFMLMLILINVDFSGQIFSQTTTIKKQSFSSTLVTTSQQTTESKRNSQDDFNAMKVFTKEATTKNIVENRLGDICNEKANVCTVICSVYSDDKALNTRLELQYKKCKDDMDVTIQASMFKNSALDKNFLSGDFTLRTLTLTNNILYTIENNSFKKPSMKNLQKLIIKGSIITKMNAQTFAGLTALKYFEMNNQEKLYELSAKDFLKPMAETLDQLVFQQSSALKKYDPAAWLSGNDFVELLDVNLNGNHFSDTLQENSFAKLIRVKSLRLKNCRISYFAENTFSKIIETLQYLDLSQNQFIQLSAEFLFSVSGTNINISISGNKFDCSCDNNEFVEAIKNTKIVFEKEPKCFAPERLYGEEIKNVKNFCENDNDNENVTENAQSTVESTTNQAIESTAIETTTSSIKTEIITTTEGIDTTTDRTIEDITTPAKYIPIETELICRGTAIKLPIQEQYIFYILRSISPNSIEIELEVFSNNIHFLYFTSNDMKHYQSIEITTIKTLIDNLITSQDYIFCALLSKGAEFSPLNCRSHHTGQGIDHDDVTWLKRSQMPLFISLTTFVDILFLFLGVIIIFFMLRWRPTLLKGSKRLFRLDTGFKKVFLSKERNASATEELYEAFRSYAAYEHNHPTMNLRNSDYLQYSQHFDALKTIYSNDNLPPAHRAPALPPAVTNQQLSNQSILQVNDAILLESISEVSDEHEYQSLDQYQEVF